MSPRGEIRWLAGLRGDRRDAFISELAVELSDLFFEPAQIVTASLVISPALGKP